MKRSFSFLLRAHLKRAVTALKEVGRARLSSARRTLTGSGDLGTSRRAEDRRALPTSLMRVAVPSSCALLLLATLSTKAQPLLTLQSGVQLNWSTTVSNTYRAQWSPAAGGPWTDL